MSGRPVRPFSPSTERVDGQHRVIIRVAKSVKARLLNGFGEVRRQGRLSD